MEDTLESQSSTNALSARSGRKLYELLTESANLTSRTALVQCTAMGAWIDLSLPNSHKWTSICYGDHPERFVAVASDTDSGSYITYRSNAHSTTLPAVSKWNSVCYSRNLNLFCAIGDNTCATSSDGNIWTIRSITPLNTTWRSICYSDALHRFYSICDTGNIIATSSDGVTWSSLTVPVTTQWSTIVYGSENMYKLCAINRDGNVAIVSSNGTEWTQVSLPVSGSYKCLGYDGTSGRFIAPVSGTNSVVVSNENATDWTVCTLPATEDWSVVVAAPEIKTTCIFARNSEVYVISRDGVNWYKRSLLYAYDYVSGVWSNSKRSMMLIASDTDKCIIGSPFSSS